MVSGIGFQLVCGDFALVHAIQLWCPRLHARTCSYCSCVALRDSPPWSPYEACVCSGTHRPCWAG